MRNKENFAGYQDINVASEFQANVHPKYNLEIFSLEITYSIADNGLKLVCLKFSLTI